MTEPDLAEDLELSEPRPAQAGAGSAASGRDAASLAMDRYAVGDDSAFGEVYDALAPRLYGYLLRQTREAARAEDLLQQTLLQIHRARGSFAQGAEVVPWAFAIARRLMIDGYRKRKREEQLVEEGAPELAAAPGTDELLHRKRLVQALDDEVSKLPEAQRVAFELTRREGLSLREVAEVLGTTVMAVKLRLHRAQLALRAGVGKRRSDDAE